MSRAALEKCVLDAWDKSLTGAVNTTVDRKMAQLAVAEVVDALRYNPAWASSLGIGK